MNSELGDVELQTLYIPCFTIVLVDILLQENMMSTALENSARPQTLRWWPAAILVALMAGLPYLPQLFEAPSLPLFLISFLGPAVLAMVVLLWWLVASRATWKERLIGTVAVLICATISILLSDKSMSGMGVIISPVPKGGIAFALPLILLAALPQVRLPVAIISCASMFAFWTLVRFDGTTGRFQSQLSWRWTETAEQKHLEQLSAAPSPVGADIGAEPPITLASAQWSSFRGPMRNGKQPGIVIDPDWKQHPPKQLWSTTIGPGWSSFTVAGNRLFTQEQRGDKEAVVCLDADGGQVVWAYEYESRFWEAVAGAGPRATPTIADEGLFALGANGVLSCLNARTGEMKWQKNIGEAAQRRAPQWGFSASPLVVSGLVIVHAGGAKDKGLLAYEAATGELKWSAPSGDHSYSSAQLSRLAGTEAILMESNTGLQFIDLSGKQLWQHEWPLKNYRALQPQVIGDSVILASTLGQGVRRLSVRHEGDSWQVTEEWTSIKLKPDFNDLVEHEGFLYGFDGDILACADASNGERAWKKGRYGNGQVVLLPDADQLLVLSEKGELALVAADPQQFTELAKVPAIGGKTWNHPVLVGNRVYVRNDQQAACFELPVK